MPNILTIPFAITQAGVFFKLTDGKFEERIVEQISDVPNGCFFSLMNVYLHYVLHTDSIDEPAWTRMSELTRACVPAYHAALFNEIVDHFEDVERGVIYSSHPFYLPRTFHDLILRDPSGVPEFMSRPCGVIADVCHRAGGLWICRSTANPDNRLPDPTFHEDVVDGIILHHRLTLPIKPPNGEWESLDSPKYTNDKRFSKIRTFLYSKYPQTQSSTYTTCATATVVGDLAHLPDYDYAGVNIADLHGFVQDHQRSEERVHHDAIKYQLLMETFPLLLRLTSLTDEDAIIDVNTLLTAYFHEKDEVSIESAKYRLFTKANFPITSPTSVFTFNAIAIGGIVREIQWTGVTDDRIKLNTHTVTVMRSAVRDYLTSEYGSEMTDHVSCDVAVNPNAKTVVITQTPRH